MILTDSGIPIIVGKNALDNERVTFEVAAENDLWFHVKDNPGSHVVLQCGSYIPSAIDIQTTANIAAHFSKAKNTNKVIVQYCLAKHVSKPEKSPRGTVSIQKSKSIIAYPYQALTTLRKMSNQNIL